MPDRYHQRAICCQTRNSGINCQISACSESFFWEVETDKTYMLGLYLYLFVASVVAGIGTAWLSPLGLTVNIIFAVVVAYLGIVVGRWLFGRVNL